MFSTVLGQLATLLASSLLVASQYPTPVEVTDVQKQVLAEQTAKAKAASNAATKDVLSFLDSKDFRSELTSCCPKAAQLSSQELLEHLRAEMRASELAHSFPGDSSGRFQDMTIDTAKQSDFWLNEWQVPLKNGEGVPTQYNEAEEGLFGCPPFKDDRKPTWDEAANRMIYIVQNTRQLDFGSVWTFGDVSVIFKKSYVKNNVLIAAVDTGLWERSCNKSSHSQGKINCNAWQPHQVGTLEHLDHLILGNFGSWSTSKDTIAQEAGRWFARTPLAGDYLKLQPMRFSDNMHYMEANILMNPRLPDAISLIVGDFASLFGTDLGTSLKELAQQRGWPLAWSRGGLSSDRHLIEKNIPGNARILDPKVDSSQALNATFPANSQSNFEKLWSSVSSGRSSGPPSHEQLDNWWNTLASQQVNVAPVSAYACSEPDSCVAVDARSGHCICHGLHSEVVV